MRRDRSTTTGADVTDVVRLLAQACAAASSHWDVAIEDLRLGFATNAPALLDWPRRYTWPAYRFTPAKRAGGPVVVAVGDDVLHERLRAALRSAPREPASTYEETPAWRQRPAPGLLALTYRHRPGVTLVDGAAQRIAFVTCEEDPQAPFEAARLVREVLVKRLERRGAFALHAGGVVVDGRGCLICGPKGAGKTTLVCSLMEFAGAEFLSNDRVQVSTGTAGARMLAWPMSIRIGAGTCLASPALRRWFRAGRRLAYPQEPWERALEGGPLADRRSRARESPKVELIPSELAEALDARATVGGEIGCVLLGQRVGSGAPHVRRLHDVADAAARIEAELLVEDAAYPDWLELRTQAVTALQAQARTVVARLARAVPVYEVRFSDGAAAVAAITPIHRCGATMHQAVEHRV